jgi:hypothetical protein
MWQMLESSLRPRSSTAARSKSISTMDDNTPVVVEADLHFKPPNQTRKLESGDVLPPPRTVNISNSITVSADVIPTQQARDGQSAARQPGHFSRPSQSNDSVLTMLSKARPEMPLAEALALVSQGQLSGNMRDILLEAARAPPTSSSHARGSPANLAQMLRTKTLHSQAPLAPPRTRVPVLAASGAWEPSSSLVSAKRSRAAGGTSMQAEPKGSATNDQVLLRCACARCLSTWNLHRVVGPL